MFLAVPTSEVWLPRFLRLFRTVVAPENPVGCDTPLLPIVATEPDAIVAEIVAACAATRAGVGITTA
jgi:hypothetical protein